MDERHYTTDYPKESGRVTRFEIEHRCRRINSVETTSRVRPGRSTRTLKTLVFPEYDRSRTLNLLPGRLLCRSGVEFHYNSYCTDVVERGDFEEEKVTEGTWSSYFLSKSKSKGTIVCPD